VSCDGAQVLFIARRKNAGHGISVSVECGHDPEKTALGAEDSLAYLVANEHDAQL
jgi:hypothetical protein